MHDSDESAPNYKPGDVANNHVLTKAGWIPLRRLPHGSQGPYYPGDVVNGHAFTGGEWVPADVPATVTPATTAGLAPHAPRSSTGRRWLIGLVVGAVIVFFALAAIGSQLEDPDETTTSATESPSKSAPTPTKATKAAPDPIAKYTAQLRKQGWTPWLSDEVWGKWAGTKTEYIGATTKLRIVSPKGCPNGVYVEMNVLDGSKTVVGFTNDALPSLAAKQQAVLQFTTTVAGKFSLAPSETSCY